VENIERELPLTLYCIPPASMLNEDLRLLRESDLRCRAIKHNKLALEEGIANDV